MTGDNWKTLRVPPEAYDEAKAQKEEHNRTWGEQIVRDTDDVRVEPATPDEVAERVVERIEGSKPLEDMAFEDWFSPDYAQTIAHHIVSELDSESIESGFSQAMQERLERIESSAGTLEERTGRIERTLEDVEGRMR